MILATMRNGRRDGELLVVSRDRHRAVSAKGVATTLQAALDDWEEVAPALQAIAERLEAGEHPDVFDLDPRQLLAPLPRAYAFLDGSAYPEHMSAVRAARGAKMPDDYLEKPMLYQGCSDTIVGPHDPIELTEDEAFGADVEAEIVVITGDVPQGVPVDQAGSFIRLIGLLNDISLRALIPAELGRGFGFLQGKSASSMGPFVVTPDELGKDWNGHLVAGRYTLHIRGVLIGDLAPGRDAAFDYPQLISHGAKTRELKAGTIIGAGALANVDRKHGCGCIAELRAREQSAGQTQLTPYLAFGDVMRLELLDDDGVSVFGAIEQSLERYGNRDRDLAAISPGAGGAGIGRS